MEPIKKVIERKYNKKFFQQMGRKWWDEMTPEQKEERRKKAVEWGKMRKSDKGVDR